MYPLKQIVANFYYNTVFNRNSYLHLAAVYYHEYIVLCDCVQYGV